MPTPDPSPSTSSPPMPRATGRWERQASEVLKAIHLDSIKAKIVVFALLATLIPSISTAWLAHNQNRRSLTERMDDELRSVARHGARETDLWLRNQELVVRTLSEADPITGFLQVLNGPEADATRAARAAQVTDYLDRVRRRVSGFIQLLVLDDLGNPVAGLAASDTLRLPGRWQEVTGTDIATGAPYWDSALNRRVVVMAVPVRPINGPPLGGLAATVDLDSLGAVLRTDWSSNDLEAFLVDQTGAVIASSGFAGVPEGAAVTAEALGTLEASDSTSVQFVSYDGVEAIGLQSAIARMGWTAVARIPEASAFARISELRNKTILLLIGLLLVVSFVAYQLALLIVRPLDRLTAGAREVATGDFAVDLPVTTGGEVGALTRVFNDMVDRLREGRERLAVVHDQLMAQNEEFERLSLTDGLTGLVNRRCLMETMTNEIARAKRSNHDLAVVIMDVDHFKKFNDLHGHLVGDEVLRGVGHVLKDVARETDCAARYGGEEFVVMLPETDRAGGMGFAERIRKRLAEEAFDVGGGKQEKVTVSIGVSSFPDFGDTPDTIISAADDALYRAKKAGRDCVREAKPKRKAAKRKS